jgi:hypothetical protein
MEKLETIATQASTTYAQAPWRKQWQLIGLFSLALVMAALVAGIYLNVSARAAATGRDIQEMQRNITTIDREIEDLQSRLALIHSARIMRDRATALGFQPILPEQMVYMAIPGFVGRQTLVLAPSSERAVVGARIVSPEYTESIYEWLQRASGSMFSFAGQAGFAGHGFRIRDLLVLFTGSAQSGTPAGGEPATGGTQP